MTIFGRPVFYGWVVVAAAFMAQFVTVGVQTSVVAVFAPEFIERIRLVAHRSSLLPTRWVRDC